MVIVIPGVRTLAIIYRKVDGIKPNRKILYHFAIFVIINKTLIIKYRWILSFNNVLFKYYQLYRKSVRDKNCLFSSHKVLKIFSEFFINFLVLYFLIYWQLFLLTWENTILKNSEKIRKKFSEFYERK